METATTAARGAPGTAGNLDMNLFRTAVRLSGVSCVPGDASDRDFLERADLHKRKTVLVSLTNHSENIDVVKMLQHLDYKGKIAVVSRFPDQQEELISLGCITFNLYAEAGHGFAERVMEEMS